MISSTYLYLPLVISLSKTKGIHSFCFTFLYCWMGTEVFILVLYPSKGYTSNAATSSSSFLHIFGWLEEQRKTYFKFLS